MANGISSLFRSSKVAASGLRSNRTWMNIISNNIANANTLDTGVRESDGSYIPYKRQVPVFAKVLSEKFRDNKINDDVLNGVEVKEVATLKDNVKKVFNPGHPAARKPGSVDAGYVYYPSVNVSQEMADLKIAAASYEANLTVMSISKKMTQQALTLSRRG